MSVTSRLATDAPRASSTISRRLFLAAAPAVLAGCVSRTGSRPLAAAPPPASARFDPYYVAMYGPLPNERFPVPATDLRYINPAFYRAEVVYPTDEAPGTVIVDANDKYLYLVQGDGTAMRYGIGVGREGFGWEGRATIRRKAPWPKWTPPADMVARDEKAAKWAGGMPAGLDNPLGARALYLYQGDQDTLYRIHGTNEPWSIGSNVSSGCIRLINQDIVDLYDRVPVGTPVVVLDGAAGGGDMVSDAPASLRRRMGSLTSLI